MTNNMKSTTIACTLPILILFLECRCFAEVLETDSECFVPDPGIEIKEYLPEYMRDRKNLVSQGQNFPIINTDAFKGLKCSSLSLKLNNIEAIHKGAFNGASINILDLSENSLKCIFKDILQVNLLEILDLSKNKITYLDSNIFSETLVSLKLDSNRLIDFDMENYARSKNIRELNLAQNGLISVNLNQNLMTKLQKLDLSYNNLNKYDFSNLSSLSYLNLKYNKLRRIEKDYFLNLNSLEELDVSNNKLEDVRLMSSSFPKLVSLKLQYNNIKHIQDDLFLLSKNLRVLDLSRNYLQYFNFTNNELRKVWLLKMNNMKLRTIHPSQFYNFDRLAELELSNNLLRDFDNSFHLPKLWRLDLSFNRLQIVDNNFINLKALGSLDLSHNSIEAFNVANCSLDRIWKMKLNNNKIVEIPDRNVPTLNFLLFLDLSNNHLKTFNISKEKLQKLRIIDLSSNHLSSYVEAVFGSFSALRFLSLRNNFIDEVPPSVYYENKKLSYLDLSFNLITSFKYNQRQKITTLTSFNIFGNPMNCLHLMKIESYAYQNQIILNHCDADYSGDGKTAFCVNYGCDCEYNIYSPLTEKFLQVAHYRRNVPECSFDELTHNGL